MCEKMYSRKSKTYCFQAVAKATGFILGLAPSTINDSKGLLRTKIIG